MFLLCLLPLMIAGMAAGTPLFHRCCPRLALLARFALGFFCHQLPERSFAFLGIQLPVCSRCTGIYLGMALSSFWWLIVVFAERLRPAAPVPFRQPARFPCSRWICTALVAAVSCMLGLDVGLQWLGLYSSNLSRFLTGYVWGFSAHSLCVMVLLAA